MFIKNIPAQNICGEGDVEFPRRSFDIHKAVSRALSGMTCTMKMYFLDIIGMI